MRVPAYGKELLSLRRRNHRPLDPVVVTNSFDTARFYRGLDFFAMVADPANAAWELCMLHDLDVSVILWPDGGWFDRDAGRYVETYDALGLLERISAVAPRSLRYRTIDEWLKFVDGWLASKANARALAD